MSKTAQVRVRLDPKLKEGATAILQNLGLTMSDAIALFMHQVVMHRGLPFAVKLPSDDVLESLQQAQRGEFEEVADFEACTASLLKEIDEESAPDEGVQEAV